MQAKNQATENSTVQVFWASIFGNLDHGVLVFDNGLMVHYANPRVTELFGYSEAELKKRGLNALLPLTEPGVENCPDLSPVPQLIAHTMDGQTSAVCEDGTRRLVDVSVSQLEGEFDDLFICMVSAVPAEDKLVRLVLERIENRNRVTGHDLHDEIGQRFAGLTLFSGTLLLQLESLLGKFDPVANKRERAEAGKALETCRRLIEKLKIASKVARQISHGLLKTPLNSRQLHDALEDLAASTNELPNTCCRFECSGHSDHEMSDEVACSLYRIAQEATANALKHSSASSIVINLNRSDGVDKPDHKRRWARL